MVDRLGVPDKLRHLIEKRVKDNDVENDRRQSNKKEADKDGDSSHHAATDPQESQEPDTPAG